MDLTSLSIRQLEVVAVIIELRSVTKAATRLGLTQSNVSHTLARARRVLDDPVVYQVGGYMEPSQKILNLIPAIKEILSLSRHNVNPKPETLSGLKKTIRLYCTSDVVGMYGNKILQALRMMGFAGCISFPRTSADIFERLEQDPLSLILRPTVILPPAMIQKKIFDETWMLICSANHPAKDIELFRYEHLLEYEFVVVRPFDGVPSPMDIAVSMRGDRRKVSAFVTNYHEMMPFIRSGTSVGIIPSSIAEHLSELYPLVRKPVNQIAGLSDFSMSMGWYPVFSKHPVSIALRAAISSVFTSGGK